MSAKWIFLAALVLMPAVSRAAIMGMLVQDERTSLAIEQLPPGDKFEVKIAVISNIDLPTLYFSRYLGGEGGSVEKMLEAMQSGRMPEPGTVAEWMPADKSGERPTKKVGVFTDNSKFEVASSMFSGQPRQIPYETSPRLSVTRLPDGRLKQVFMLRFAQVVSPFGDVRSKTHDIALVTQAFEKGAFDASLRSSLVMKSKSLMAASDREFAAYRKKIMREMCRELFVTTAN